MTILLRNCGLMRAPLKVQPGDHSTKVNAASYFVTPVRITLRELVKPFVSATKWTAEFEVVAATTKP